MVKIRQIRESIEIPIVEVNNGLTIVQRQINLTPNVQHNLINCDMFIDNLFIDNSRPEVWQGIMEVFVSPYPIIYSDNTIGGFSNRGPTASQDGVLFKALLNGGNVVFTDQFNGTEFPNQYASFNSEFDFYHPNLYITLLIHSSDVFIMNDLALSFLFTLSQKKVNSLNYSLGLWKETQELMAMNITTMGRLISPSRNVGQIAPSWKWGGARPELTASAQTLSEFWYKTDTMEGEPTGTPTELRDRVKRARQMVENPDAFGTPSGGDDVPDWIAFITEQGYEAGPVREQWPPIKHADNGNVLTL